MSNELLSLISTKQNPTSFSNVSNSTIILTVFSLLCCVFGLIGNVVVILLITVLKEYSKSTNKRYILQLAIANLLFLLTVPFEVTQDIRKEWIFPEWMCKAKQTILSINFYASIMVLMVMSFDSYIAVCRPQSNIKRKIHKMKTSLIISAIIWTIALLLTIPVMMYSFKSGQEPFCTCQYQFPLNEDPRTNEKNSEGYGANFEFSTQRCGRKDSYDLYSGLVDYFGKTLEFSNFGNSSFEASTYEEANVIESDYKQENGDKNNGNYLEPGCFYQENSNFFVAYISFDFIAMFLFPLSIMIICYGLIIRRVFITGRRIRSQIPSFSSTSSRKEKKKQTFNQDKHAIRIAKLCAILVSSFVICWILYHSFRVAKIRGIYNVQTEVCKTISEVGTFLVFLNAALNPYIYTFLGMDFRSRWRNATLSVRKSVSRVRISSSGSAIASSKAKSRHNSRANLFPDQQPVKNMK